MSVRARYYYKVNYVPLRRISLNGALSLPQVKCLLR